VFADQREAPLFKVQKFVEELVKMGNISGVKVQDPRPRIKFCDGEARDFQQAMTQLRDENRAAGKDLKFVLCMIKGQTHVYGK
jgi:hypothetical protein